MVDCAITGTGSGVAARWPEVTTHISNLPVAWALAGYMVNVTWWNRQDPAVRAFLEGTFREMSDKLWELGDAATRDGIDCAIGKAEGCRIHTLAARPMTEVNGDRGRPGAAPRDPGEDRAAGLRAPLRRALRGGLQRGGRAARRGALRRVSGRAAAVGPSGLRAAERLRRGVAALAAGMAYLAGWNYIACALFITADIVGRNLFGVSSAATVEVTGYMLAGGIAWALAHTLARGAHIRVDVWVNRLPLRLRAALHLFALLLLGGFAVFCAWAAWSLVDESLLFDAHDNSALRVPLVLPQGMWLVRPARLLRRRSWCWRSTPCCCCWPGGRRRWTGCSARAAGGRDGGGAGGGGHGARGRSAAPGDRRPRPAGAARRLRCWRWRPAGRRCRSARSWR